MLRSLEIGRIKEVKGIELRYKVCVNMEEGITIYTS